jgi:hypothetical protein
MCLTAHCGICLSEEIEWYMSGYMSYVQEIVCLLLGPSVALLPAVPWRCASDCLHAQYLEVPGQVSTAALPASWSYLGSCELCEGDQHWLVPLGLQEASA